MIDTLWFHVCYLSWISEHANYVYCRDQNAASIHYLVLSTYANVLGLFYWIAFSTILLEVSGILSGSKLCKKIPGLRFACSHIISKVFSRPWIVVLMSRFGRLVNCWFTVWVIRETNWRCRYSNCIRMKVEDGLILLLRRTFLESFVWGGSSKYCTPSLELIMQI